MPPKKEVTKITALRELYELFRDVRLGKDRRENNAKYNYFSANDVQKVVDATIKKTKFFYSLYPFTVEVYHEDIEEPIKVVRIDKTHFNKTEAGKVTIMSPEQRVLSQVAFAQKGILAAAFNLIGTADPDMEVSQAQENSEKALQNKYENWFTHIKTVDMTETPVEKIIGLINDDPDFTEVQKMALVAHAKEYHEKMDNLRKNVHVPTEEELQEVAKEIPY